MLDDGEPGIGLDQIWSEDIAQSGRALQGWCQ
jgi:hypothetical protein